jgi:hypothetical protein
VYVAELTNDIDDEASYREKEKVFCSLSLHGDERAGSEAGLRFIEDLLRGNEAATEQYLDDAVILLAFTNPDGWAARHPQYQGKFQRGNAAVGDTNRQYPIVGWINPSRFPAEPRGTDATDDSPGIDSDVPLEYLENVPDSLAIVEHFRDYENLNYGADFHGASVFGDDFVFALISQAQYDHREFHELYGLNKDIDTALSEAIQPQPYTSNEYDYATIWDLLGYTDSGIQGDWLAHPESLGGLGMTSLDFEMAFSNTFSTTFYDPNRNTKQVTGYKQGIRTLTEFAVRYSDTRNTSDEFSADVETGGLDTAVVTTDALTRSSDQLVPQSPDEESGGLFGGGAGTGADRQVAVDRDTSVTAGESSLSLADGPGVTSLSVPTETHTLSLSLEPDGPIAATLRDPSGEVARSRDVTDGPAACGSHVDFLLREPTAGSWTLAVEPRTATDEVNDASVTAESATVETTTVQTANGTATPDPEAALGYGQFDYKVSPLVFFDADFFDADDELRALEGERDLDDFTDADGNVDTLSVAEVAAGAAAGYDNLLVLHDDGIDDADYVAALDAFVESGGNLVATDSGVGLLGAMDAALTSAIGEGDTLQERYYVANLGEKRSDHPLVEGARPVQNQLWKVAGLGYSIGTEAPMTLVDQAAFEAAGGTAAGVQDAGVSAGSIIGDVDGEVTTRELAESDAGSVHFVGGAFPPASQSNLHPFGLLDYSVSFLGYLMLTNALGYVQRRSVGGEQVTFGGNATFAGSAAPAPGGFSASGTREDDGDLFTSGATNRVRLTVTGLSDAATISDRIPDDWSVASDAGDVERVEGNEVHFGETDPVGDGESVTLEYFAEAPEGVSGTGRYTFGPATATAAAADDDSTDDFGGTVTKTVIGVRA